MSWDIVIVKEKFDLNSEHYHPKQLGNRDKIINDLKALLPNFDEVGELLEEDGYTIEFSIDESDEIDSITLRVYGGGNPLNTIKLILIEMNWQAIDCQTGAFINLDKDDTHSWQEPNNVISSDKSAHALLSRPKWRDLCF